MENFNKVRVEVEQISRMARLNIAMAMDGNSKKDDSEPKQSTRTSERSSDAAVAKSVAQPRPVTNAALKAWWDSMDSTSKVLPQTDLLGIAKAAFPEKMVSRERVRVFTKGRKTGPRPIGGKATAE